MSINSGSSSWLSKSFTEVGDWIWGAHLPVHHSACTWNTLLHCFQTSIVSQIKQDTHKSISMAIWTLHPSLASLIVVIVLSLQIFTGVILNISRIVFWKFHIQFTYAVVLGDTFVGNTFLIHLFEKYLIGICYLPDP
ncbi:hypothetical protein HJG60_011549 [Phyllostomus discolor]|uniref:Uncharacterized protein n=1 Tax=Phyllostomus discolor TaxID=89673 RepID=A0A833ZVG4_9CHIR|nr:hypothetical protein HJG60_011549 [Phyllostomus discolor]